MLSGEPVPLRFASRLRHEGAVFKKVSCEILAGHEGGLVGE